LRWRLLYPLSYKEPHCGSSKAGFEPATFRLEVTVAFATGEDRYFCSVKRFAGVQAPRVFVSRRFPVGTLCCGATPLSPLFRSLAGFPVPARH